MRKQREQTIFARAAHFFFLISKKTTLHVQHALTAAIQFSCFSSNEIGLRFYSLLALALSLLCKLM